MLALEELDLTGCRSLEALPDHLCSSVKLAHLGIGGSGIVLIEDYIIKILAPGVDLDIVDTSFPSNNRDVDESEPLESEEWDDV